ncbi:response regulator [Leptolyngbya cf. ectocarpi LEGE 11479]|uniref:Response regulator n=1 Tax=Leptolyngbya cf. ectocarpi LEGE 11479 TaxID=1828722 RepID=A0A929FA82_LEPEC|nr:response regulator [Leptolyngbya ectocarpi]MBE9069801.1 response regulator [Leptolyngbya cf. ectocarpi LEGE 11479]
MGSTDSKNSPTVLIVDDHDDNLLLLNYIFEDLGYATIQGSSGKDAINLTAKHRPDLVLLDILLPDMNGMTVIRHLRRIPGMQNTAIIAVTALAGKLDRSKIIAAGFTEYLSKPYMIDELAAVVHRYLLPT